ncbi:MAG TPA: hypothetical protein PK760_09000, partial [Flavobacteriales bacterium]|nr:hypothetical protein [Flavobacteriales bacterium]
MQNRGALWTLTILLALACAYQLSFSFFTSGLEKEARIEAERLTDSLMTANPALVKDASETILGYENQYLREHGNDVVYPILGKTYRECKESEINMGLDLKGGMAVTLEVSIPELIQNLSGNSKEPAFVQAIANARAKQVTDNSDFVTLFGEEFAKIPNHPSLSAIFYSPDRKAMFEREGSDADYITALKREAATALENTERILRTRIDKFGVTQPTIQKQQFSGRISVELPGVKDKERVRRVLQSTANLEFWETYENTEIGPMLDKANEPLSRKLYPELANGDAVDTTAVDTTVAQTPDQAMIDSNKVDDSSEVVADTTNAEPLDTLAAQAEARKKAPLSVKLQPNIARNGWASGPVVGIANLNDTADVMRMLAMEEVRSALPIDVKLVWGAKPVERQLNSGGTGMFLDLYALRVPRGGKPKLDGSSVTNAFQDFDMKGEVEVTMQMNAEGAQTWKLMTGENIGKCVAIVLDNVVRSAPVVQTEIAGGSSVISMGSGSDLNAQINEANDLANILKAGALPAPARIIDESVVGASLGDENVHTGLISFIVALIAVMLYMFAYYARAGWVADISLLVNLFLLIGSLASLQAALTL